MDEKLDDVNLELPSRPRRRWRLRFRITTLLWLTVIVAAFFVGRRSGEIERAASLWWQVTRVRWGASVTKTEIIQWPPGSITINEPNTIQKAVVYDPRITSVAFLTSNQMQISPKGDGKTTVTYTLTSGQFRNGQFDCNVERGRIGSNWGLSQR